MENSNENTPLDVDQFLTNKIAIAVRQFWILMVSLVGATAFIISIYYGLNVDVERLTIKQQELDASMKRVEASVEKNTNRHDQLIKEVHDIELEMARRKNE